MFKLLYTSDLHGNTSYYQRLLKRASEKDVGAIAIGGDLTPRGGDTLEEWIATQRKFLEEFLIPLFRTFKKIHPKKEIFLIMGNDDFKKNMDIIEQASTTGVLKSIHKKTAVLHKDISLVGYSIVNTTPFRIKDWEKDDFKFSQKPKMMSHQIFRTVEEEKGTVEEDLQELKKLSDPKKTIYVMHAPPFDTNLDIITTKEHVGSEAIREFILKEKPLMTLHGHIHESPEMSGSWMDILGKTTCINVGSSYPEPKVNCALIDLDNLNNIQYKELEADEAPFKT